MTTYDAWFLFLAIVAFVVVTMLLIFAVVWLLGHAPEDDDQDITK